MTSIFFLSLDDWAELDRLAWPLSISNSHPGPRGTIPKSSIARTEDLEKTTMTKPTPYKIQDVRRKRRIGIVARNLNDLIEHAGKKLGLANANDCRVCLEDGTEIDEEEYFQTLPPQTVFVFVKPDENWEGCKYYLE